MRVGVAREIKDQENRVALTPAGARALAQAGHTVCVERGAGAGSGFEDAQYRDAGATLGAAADAWRADLVLKVKEPLRAEFPHLAGQIVFTYFHLAGVDPALTEVLLDRRVTAVAYETVEDAEGALPLLRPMSAVAGHMAVTVGSHYLARCHGGRGVLLGRLLGRRSGKAVVIGTGVVGRHAAVAAGALGAEVVVCGRTAERAGPLAREIGPDALGVASSGDEFARHVQTADLLVGGALVPGARAPALVDESLVAAMQPGAVIVDVSIDQGGCVATSRPTSHSDPVFERHGVVHYCVTNMPGAYPRTSTIALSDATLPYALRLADGGVDALTRDAGFAKGVNTHAGRLTSEPVAAALGLEAAYEPFGDAVAA